MLQYFTWKTINLMKAWQHSKISTPVDLNFTKVAVSWSTFSFSLRFAEVETKIDNGQIFDHYMYDPVFRTLVKLLIYVAFTPNMYHINFENTFSCRFKEEVNTIHSRRTKMSKTNCNKLQFLKLILFSLRDNLL